MATESRLVGIRVPVSWRSAQIAFTRWHDWLPAIDVQGPDPDDARVELARRYLESFGPATVDDFAWWSGLTKAQARRAIGDAGATPVGDGFDLGEGGGDPPAGVRLLPIWDTLFVTWKDRTRFLPDRLLPFVYDSSGNATSTVLVDGTVAGVWAMGSDDEFLEVRVALFDDATPRMWAAIEAEAAILGEVAGSTEVRVVQAGPPPDLRAGTATSSCDRSEARPARTNGPGSPGPFGVLRGAQPTVSSRNSSRSSSGLGSNCGSMSRMACELVGYSCIRYTSPEADSHVGADSWSSSPARHQVGIGGSGSSSTVTVSANVSS